MRSGRRIIKPVLYTFTILFGAWLLLLGYGRFIAFGAGTNRDRATWVTPQEILHLTRFHGTDALKITEDEVFIRRNNRWLPVLKRVEG